MTNAIIKIGGWFGVVGGLFLMGGAAGSDCDGACMANAPSLGMIALLMLMGLVIFGTGIFLVTRDEQI
jgi:hypothetical protein